MEKSGMFGISIVALVAAVGIFVLFMTNNPPAALGPITGGGYFAHQRMGVDDYSYDTRTGGFGTNDVCKCTYKDNVQGFMRSFSLSLLTQGTEGSGCADNCETFCSNFASFKGATVVSSECLPEPSFNR